MDVVVVDQLSKIGFPFIIVYLVVLAPIKTDRVELANLVVGEMWLSLLLLRYPTTKGAIGRDITMPMFMLKGNETLVVLFPGKSASSNRRTGRWLLWLLLLLRVLFSRWG